MPDTQLTPRPRNLSRQWLLGSLALAVLAVLLWWFWPSPPEAPARGGPWRDGGPVPVRVANVTQGDFPVELKALGTVTAYNTVNVRGRVEGELVKLLFKDGQQVKAGDLLAVIDPRSYEIALQQAQGALESVDNLIDTAAGTVKLKARFANAEEMLFPNQFVNVRLRVKTLQNVTLMPAAALQFGASGTFAYVVDAEDKVQLTPISIGASDGQLSVVEQGLKPGDRLVLEGTDRLRSGNQVEVIGDKPVAAQAEPATLERQGAPRAQ